MCTGISTASCFVQIMTVCPGHILHISSVELLSLKYFLTEFASELPNFKCYRQMISCIFVLRNQQHL